MFVFTMFSTIKKPPRRAVFINNDRCANVGGAMVYLDVCFNTEYALQDFLGRAGIVIDTVAGVYHYYD